MNRRTSTGHGLKFYKLDFGGTLLWTFVERGAECRWYLGTRFDYKSIRTIFFKGIIKLLVHVVCHNYFSFSITQKVYERSLW
jgi:hypothetical protein